MKKSVLSIACLGISGVLLASLWMAKVYGTGSATLTLNPASGSYNNGDAFTASIYENSGAEAVNAVEADLSYDQAKLQLTSIDTASSAFTTTGSTSGGSGSISIGRADAGGSLTGNQLVAVLNFKALVGSGSSAVSFSSSSGVVRYSDSVNIWNGVTTGGNYSFTTPAPPSTPSTPPTPSSQNTSNSTSNTTTTVTPSHSTTTSQSSNNTGAAANSSSNVTTTTLPAQGAASSTPITLKSLSGYFVAIKVLDTKGNPIRGAAVTIDKQTATTDATGVASFTAVPSGSHTVTVKDSDTKTQTQSKVDVSSQKPQQSVQQFNVRLASSHSSWPVAVVVILLVLLLLLGGGGGFWFRHGRSSFRKFFSRHNQHHSSTIVADVNPVDSHSPSIVSTSAKPTLAPTTAPHPLPPPSNLPGMIIRPQQ